MTNNHAWKHNQVHGNLVNLRQRIRRAMRAESLTARAITYLVLAGTAMDDAIDEAWQRRINPDGEIVAVHHKEEE